MKYDTLIFDLDGTLLYTLDDLRTAVNMALREFGWQDRTEDEVRRFVGNGVRNLMRRAVPGGDKNPLFEECFAAFKRAYAEHQFDTTRPYDGIMETVEKLQKDGCRMAIVSNKIDFAVQDLNDRFFHMDVAAGDMEGQRRKPYPDMVFRAMEQLGCKPEKTVYIGDSEVDIQTAKNSGLDCISAAWGFRTHEELEAAGAEVYAEKPEDLIGLVEHGI